MRKFIWLFLCLAVGLLSGVLSIGREVLGFWYPQRFTEGRLLGVSVAIAEFISLTFAWWLEHRQVLIERAKNEGSRIEGKILEAFIDSKKDNRNGTITLLDSAAYVTILLTATNLNPAPAYLDPLATTLTLQVNGLPYEGKYEFLNRERLDYFATSAAAQNGHVYDFFHQIFNPSGPMADGLPLQGWIRFYCERMVEAKLKSDGEVRASLKLTLVDTRKKRHLIEATLPLRFNCIKHRAEI